MTKNKPFKKKTSDIDVKKLIDKLTKKFPPKVPGHFGGLIFEKSRCCGAPVTLSKGGLRRRICSACGKAVIDRVF